MWSAVCPYSLQAPGAPAAQIWEESWRRRWKMENAKERDESVRVTNLGSPLCRVGSFSAGRRAETLRTSWKRGKRKYWITSELVLFVLYSPDGNINPDLHIKPFSWDDVAFWITENWGRAFWFKFQVFLTHKDFYRNYSWRFYTKDAEASAMMLTPWIP